MTRAKDKCLTQPVAAGPWLSVQIRGLTLDIQGDQLKVASGTRKL